MPLWVDSFTPWGLNIAATLKQVEANRRGETYISAPSRSEMSEWRKRTPRTYISAPSRSEMSEWRKSTNPSPTTPYVYNPEIPAIWSGIKGWREITNPSPTTSSILPKINDLNVQIDYPEPTPFEKQLRAEYATLDAQYSSALGKNSIALQNQLQALEAAIEDERFKALFAAGVGNVGIGGQRVQNLSLRNFATKSDLQAHYRNRRIELEFERNLKSREFTAKLASQPGALERLTGSEVSDVAGGNKIGVGVSSGWAQNALNNFTKEQIGEIIYNGFKKQLNKKEQALFDGEFGDRESRLKLAEIITSSNDKKAVLAINKKDFSSVSWYSPRTSEISIYTKSDYGELKLRQEASLQENFVNTLKEAAKDEFEEIKDSIYLPGSEIADKVAQTPDLAERLIGITIEAARNKFVKGQFGVDEMEDFKTQLDYLIRDPARMALQLDTWISQHTQRGR